MALVDCGFVLSLRELAVATGYSYSSFRGWKRMGLPILSGRVTWDDFQSWKRKKFGLEFSQGTVVGMHTVAAHQGIGRVISTTRGLMGAVRS